MFNSKYEINFAWYLQSIVFTLFVFVTLIYNLYFIIREKSNFSLNIIEQNLDLFSSIYLISLAILLIIQIILTFFAKIQKIK